MEKVVLNAAERKTVSKSALNNLRRDKRVPGVFYIRNQKPLSIEVPEKEIKPLVFTAETHLISLLVNGH